ncbi:MAG TPA: SDR family oxidoreductase [Anaerolineaceae bacterium]|jgi:NAD(P)-dependent dehydrogenase (short-subunit alcohol dehydrogenase family)
MGAFSEKVVLITGAGQGLGRRAALALAREGANLALNDLTPIHLDETVSEVRGLGCHVKAYLEDVAKRMPVQLLADQVMEDWGKVDVIVLAASVRPTDPLSTMDEWDWHRTVDVNLTAPFLVMQALAPAMQTAGGGTIVTIGPIRHQTQDTWRMPAYAASKAGLLALTRGAAAEFAPYRIRVNAVFSERDVAFSTWISEATLRGAPRSYEGLVTWLAGPNSSPATGKGFIFDPE